MATQRKISSVWQYFDEEESDNRIVGQLCMQNLTHVLSDVNLQGEQATTSNSRQTNNVITTFATPAHRECDASQSKKIK